jgi:hypothetical protein
MERAAISDNDDGEGKGRAKEQHDPHNIIARSEIALDRV